MSSSISSVVRSIRCGHRLVLSIAILALNLTPANQFLIGQEDVPTPLNLTVDPSLQFGGTLQDIIDVAALFRVDNAGTAPVSVLIPPGTTSINVTCFATRNVATNQRDDWNDDYQVMLIDGDRLPTTMIFRNDVPLQS